MTGGSTSSLRARRYAVDLLRADGSQVASVPVAPNLEPALEAARFRAVRRGHPPGETVRFSASVEPVWDAALGDPYVTTLRVCVHDGAGGVHTCELPPAYFRGLAEHAAARVADSGSAGAGEVTRYRICAFPADRGTLTDFDLYQDGDVEEVAPAIGVEERDAEEHARGSLVLGAHDPQDVCAFVPERVHDEILATARAAGDVETGGFLIGHLRRVRGGCDVFVEVTEHVPALHAEHKPMSIVFTPATWRHVRGVIDLRARGEVLCAWWHLHPSWCSKCPAENRARCAFRKPFFSNEDIDVQASCFPRAWQLALLVTDLGEPELRVNLFGWRDGILVERGFHMTKNPLPAATAASLTAPEGIGPA